MRSLHLTPDAAEWIIAALTVIGTAGLSRDLQAVEPALVRLPETLAEALRAAAVAVVEGLAQDTVGAIRDDAKATLVDLLE